MKTLTGKLLFIYKPHPGMVYDSDGKYTDLPGKRNEVLCGIVVYQSATDAHCTIRVLIRQKIYRFYNAVFNRSILEDENFNPFINGPYTHFVFV